eukprot:1303365-Prymnesium_polylepis.1
MHGTQGGAGAAGGAVLVSTLCLRGSVCKHVGDFVRTTRSRNEPVLYNSSCNPVCLYARPRLAASLGGPPSDVFTNALLTDAATQP